MIVLYAEDLGQISIDVRISSQKRLVLTAERASRHLSCTIRT